MENEESGTLLQVLGSVTTRAGRLLVFPNVLQHQVSSFSLADPTKPGYRKILAMFLVDPHIRVLSTANVPPQRRDWWAEEVRKLEWFSRFPTELFEHIIDQVEEPWSMDDAKNVREQLMERRGKSNDAMNEDMEEVRPQMLPRIL